jgi:hypothetical protein
MRRYVRWSLASAVASLAVGSILAPACSSSSSDTPADDASVDTKKPKPIEASTDEDTGTTADAGGCEPQPVSPAPAYHAPRPVHQSACSQAEADEYVSACLNSTQVACDAFKTGHATCFGCIDADESSATRGPVVWQHDRANVSLNFGGCYEILEGEVAGAGCGAAYTRVRDCESSACGACPNLKTTKGYASYQACTTSVGIQTVCADEIAASNVKCALADNTLDASSIAAACALGPTFSTNLANYLALWCVAPGDAGADGD